MQAIYPHSLPFFTIFTIPMKNDIFTSFCLKYMLILCILIAGCGTDLLSKRWAKSVLPGKPPQVLVPGFVEVGYSENRGMVFGIMNDGKPNVFKSALTWVRMVIFLGVSGLIVAWRKRPFWVLFPFLLIWGGAVGNVVDSFKYGFVVDFIHIHAGTILDWPFYFNLADAYLCVGMGILILLSFVTPKGAKKT
jgi:signal peptidase II